MPTTQQKREYHLPMAAKRTKGTATPPRWPQTPLSRFLVRRLNELEITQKDFAERLAVDESYVSNFVNGRTPDVHAPGFIDRWARALEVDREHFIVEAELWRYNLVPPRSTELAPDDRAVLSAVAHLPPAAKVRVARGLRVIFPPDLRPDEEGFVTRLLADAPPAVVQEAREAVDDLLPRPDASGASAPPATPTTPPPSTAPAAPEQPAPEGPPDTQRFPAG